MQFLVRDSKILWPLPGPEHAAPVTAAAVTSPMVTSPIDPDAIKVADAERTSRAARRQLRFDTPAEPDMLAMHPAPCTVALPAQDAVPVGAHPTSGTQTDSRRTLQDIARKTLWHGRMPTAGCQALSKLAEKYPDVFNFDPRTKLPPCTVCHRSSIRKAAAPAESKRQVQPLEEVHFDLFFVHGEIVLMLIDRASRYE